MLACVLGLAFLTPASPYFAGGLEGRPETNAKCHCMRVYVYACTYHAGSLHEAV
jgi:hypothetical protein